MHLNFHNYGFFDKNRPKIEWFRYDAITLVLLNITEMLVNLKSQIHQNKNAKSESEYEFRIQFFSANAHW